MLQKVDKERLDKVLQVIDTAKIRFPLAEIVKRLQVDKGMVSAYLNGKKPISDKFYSNFMHEFAPETINVMREPYRTFRNLVKGIGGIENFIIVLCKICTFEL